MSRVMKDSGIEWIGEIPEEWEIRKLKFLCHIKTGNKDTINRDPEGEYPFYVRSPIIERISTYSYDGEAILMAGDGVGAGKVIHYINGKFDYHQRVYNMFNFKNVIGKYFYYYLKENFCNEVEKSNAKSTVDSIRLPMILNFPICICKKNEQQKIANFLDKKTQQIENIIKKQNEMIENLKTYKQSLITETVTKGLNHNVKMKDSGIEWIGDVPQEYDVAKLKNYMENITDGAHVSPITENGRYDFVSVTDFKENEIDFDNCLKTSEESYIALVKNGCKPKIKDVLLSKDGTVGKSIVVHEEHEFVVASSLMIFTPNDNINSQYLNYLFKSNVVQEQLRSYLKGSGLKRVSIKNSSKVVGVFPPLEEQQQIANFLDKKCKAIDDSITKKQELIEKLEIYKKSLIYECVTGKRYI